MDPILNLSDSQKQQIQDAFTNLKNSIIGQIDEFDTSITTILQLNQKPLVSNQDSPLPPTSNNSLSLPSDILKQEILERQSQSQIPSLDLNSPTQATTPDPNLNLNIDPNQLNQLNSTPISIPSSDTNDNSPISQTPNLNLNTNPDPNLNPNLNSFPSSTSTDLPNQETNLSNQTQVGSPSPTEVGPAPNEAISEVGSPSPVNVQPNPILNNNNINTI